MSVQKYRDDIDGLRAIAVVAVLLFHYGATFFPGGYVGVDIFFVISGYLITGIIVREIDAEKFSIANFYERRIRRIFPALFFMLITTIPLSYIFLLPQELKDFGQSLTATTLFSSNFLFFMEAGYFDAESHIKPLLHTWSLAVEEQYYVVFPLLLIAIGKWSDRKRLLILIAAWIASLALSALQVTSSPDAAFFLAPGRMWELLTGSILALIASRIVLTALMANILGILGIVLIGVSIFGFNHATSFPGPSALIPCVGSALIILSGQRPTLVTRVLSTRPFVMTGLISYSLYLWHWPIFVFYYLYLDAPLPLVATLFAAALSYGLAWVSWAYIERPFRRKDQYTRRGLFAAAAVLSIITMTIGAVFHFKDGLPNRLTEVPRNMSEMVATYHKYLPRSCLSAHLKPEDQSLICKANYQADAKHDAAILIFGDSHAAALIPGFVDPNHFDKDILFVGMQGCPPLLGVSISSSASKRPTTCSQFNARAIKEIEANNEVSEVILSAHWSLYADGTRLPTDPNHGSLFLFNVDRHEPLITDVNPKEIEQGLTRTIERLQAAGKKVTIMGPVPEIRTNGLTSVARMEMLGRTIDPGQSREEVDLRLAKSVIALENVAKATHSRLVFPHEVLCDAATCPVGQNYHDRHHLSPIGARLVVKRLLAEGN